MREIRTHGSEGGDSGSTGVPYPYPSAQASLARWLAFTPKKIPPAETKVHLDRRGCFSRYHKDVRVGVAMPEHRPADFSYGLPPRWLVQQ